MKYLILGASSGLGRDLAYIFAKNSHSLVLLSRDERDLKSLKLDLENRFKTEIDIIKIDASLKDSVSNFLDANDKLFQDLDGVLFPIGMMIENDNVINSSEVMNRIIQANFLSVVEFINKVLENFKKKNKGVIIGFGTVSASLGRPVNTLYSGSKRALESYFESLSSTFLKDNLKIQFYTLGYLDTNLSFDKKLILPKGSTKKLANKVYRNINKKDLKQCYPFWWVFILLTIKLIPFFILKKITRFLS
ncbi:SDR family NAD(P)-dependent oxidoreductase [Candidatus Pelagibacter sp.]|nr:SDR family NAD(P)-dependent oxidoreductase [Candidatus Pelagibacter sp.]